MDYGQIGQKIFQRRKELGLTLEQVGKPLGVNKSTVMRWEKGDVSKLKRGHVYLLSKTLYIPVEVLLGLEDDTNVEDAKLVKAKLELNDLIEQISDINKLEDLKKYIEIFVLK